ncbi:MAG: protein kinase, partial [Gammaproteobacteria bacterium]
DESIKLFSTQHKKKVARYIDAAIKSISRNCIEHKIETLIKNTALVYQYNAFLDKEKLSAENLNAIHTPRRRLKLHDYLGINHIDISNEPSKGFLDSVKTVDFDRVKYFSEEVNKEIALSINKEISLSINKHQPKNKFKSFKKDDIFRRAPFTQIRAESGDIYELMNTLNEQLHKDEIESLHQLHDISFDSNSKHKLGEGTFGKVRLARSIKTGEIVAVKKIKSEPNRSPNRLAEEEKNILEKRFENEPNNNRYFITFRDYAKTEEKSYIFMSLAGSQDGVKTICNLHEDIYNNGIEHHEQEVRNIAKSYTQCINELHKKGLSHRDIKPGNFLHGKKGIKLGDFGSLTHVGNIKNNFYAGTPEFSPPEALGKVLQKALDRPLQEALDRPLQEALKKEYQETLEKIFPNSEALNIINIPIKHDAFSLGMSLLELRYGRHPLNFSMGKEKKKVEATVEKMKFKYPGENRYRPVFFRISIPNDPEANANANIDDRILRDLKGETLDEVIAKLLIRDPNKRITPQEALELPYFKSQNS